MKLAMVVVVFRFGASDGRRKKSEESVHFRPSTVLRRRRAFVGHVLALPPIWLIDALLYRMLEVLNVFGRRICLVGEAWSGQGEFLVVLPVFLFVITTSSHAFFSFSKAQIHVAFNLERPGGLGLTWITCFGFVLSFLLMWVRFVSCELLSSFAFATASHAFLSLIGVPFDRSFH